MSAYNLEPVLWLWLHPQCSREFKLLRSVAFLCYFFSLQEKNYHLHSYNVLHKVIYFDQGQKALGVFIFPNLIFGHLADV